MGKAVVIVFFLIGFVIFSMLKYAGAGIKAAYKHVNDEFDHHSNGEQPKKVDNKDPSTTLVKMIAETLHGQFAFSGSPSPSKMSEDDFVVGYVGGYVEGCMQMTNITLTEAERFGVLTVTFFDIFGHEKGIELLQPIVHNPESMSGTFANGWSVGADDVYQWLGGAKGEEKQPPTGLIRHLHGDRH